MTQFPDKYDQLPDWPIRQAKTICVIFSISKLRNSSQQHKADFLKNVYPALSLHARRWKIEMGQMTGEGTYVLKDKYFVYLRK